MSEIQRQYPVGTRIRLRVRLGSQLAEGSIGRVSAHLREGGGIQVEMANGQVCTLGSVASLEREPAHTVRDRMQEDFPIGTVVRVLITVGRIEPGMIGRVVGYGDSYLEVALSPNPTTTVQHVALTVDQVERLGAATQPPRQPAALPGNQRLPIHPTELDLLAQRDAHFDARLMGVLTRMRQMVRNGPMVSAAETMMRALQEEARQRASAAPSMEPIDAALAEAMGPVNGPPLEIDWNAVSRETPTPAPEPETDQPMRRTYRCRVSTDNLISPTITTADDVVARGGLPAVGDDVLWLVDRQHDQHRSEQNPMNGEVRHMTRTVTYWYVRNRDTEIAGPFTSQEGAEAWCSKLCTPVHRT